MKKTLVFFLVLLMVFGAVGSAFGAVTVDQVPNNVLKLGSDFFSMTSNAFSSDATVMGSLGYGPNKNRAYFKTGGYWYNVLTLTDAQIGQSANAESATNVANWDVRTWYKSGDATDTVTKTGGLSVTSFTADSLAVTAGATNTWTVAKSTTTPNASIGAFTITFSANITKATPDDITVRAYNTSNDTLTISNPTAIKLLLFQNFSSGNANQLSGDISRNYASVVSAINASCGGATVTKLQFDVKSATTPSSTLTVTLNITAP